MLQVSAKLAIAFGVVLGVGEFVRNVGTWQWWPFWLVDYIAVGLLCVGGWWVLKERPLGARLLAGAWGFTFGIFYMSFWSHVESISEPSGSNIPHLPLTVLIGLMLGVAVAGFVMALAPRDVP